MGNNVLSYWHVDDLKILHVDPKVANNIIKRLEVKFEQESPLVTSQGKIIKYLGMCIDYTEKESKNIDV